MKSVVLRYTTLTVVLVINTYQGSLHLYVIPGCASFVVNIVNKMAKTAPNTEIMIIPDERMLAAHAAREMPNIGNMSVSNSRKVHVGPKFVSVNQTVQNKEMIKGESKYK